MPREKKQSMQDAYLKAYEEHADSIFRFCLYKTSQRELAKDLAQDVFIRAWDYVITEKKIDNFKALFFRIANNLVIDHYRRKKEGSLDELIEAGFDPTSGDETTRLGSRIDSREVLKVLDQLEEPYRDIIVLRFIEDMAVKDIAVLYKERENNISVKIYRALNQLREILNA
jgi:RNA polymerase sigma-70 factor, ECF subfamily